MNETIEEGVRLQIEGPIATIRLDRPSKLNALNREMVAELAAICREVEHSSARVALITGAGE